MQFAVRAITGLRRAAPHRALAPIATTRATTMAAPTLSVASPCDVSRRRGSSATRDTALSKSAAHMAAAVPNATGVVVESAKGCWVRDVSGEEFLDFTAGIGACSTGHAHPRVVEAIAAQAAKGIHLQQACMLSTVLPELAERLAGIAPEGLTRAFFNNSGAEAVESAVKLARHATGRPNIVVFQGSYHGRSIGTMGLTKSKTVYSAGYGPFMPGTVTVPFPYCLHCPGRFDPAVDVAAGGCCNNPIDQLRLAFKQQSAPEDTAAVLLEPILGEGGYVVPPDGFWAQLREVCDEAGVLLIADEVQSGFGRTGSWYAVEQLGGQPDILITAKGLASGMPLSGIVARPELYDNSPLNSMGGTYGGNVVAAAAALATMDVIESEGVLANVVARGEQMQARLRGIAARHPDLVLDVRGMGLMVGVEFKEGASVPAGVASLVAAAARKRGLLLLTTGVWETIRFIPPLVVSDAEMAQAMDIVDAAFDEVAAAM